MSYQSIETTKFSFKVHSFDCPSKVTTNCTVLDSQCSKHPLSTALDTTRLTLANRLLLILAWQILPPPPKLKLYMQRAIMHAQMQLMHCWKVSDKFNGR